MVGVTDFTTKACRLQCILRDPIRAQTTQSSTLYLPRWNRDITPSVEDWLSFKSQVPSEEAALWKKRAFVCKLLTLSNQSGGKKNQPNNPIKHRLQQEAKKMFPGDGWRFIFRCEAISLTSGVKILGLIMIRDLHTRWLYRFTRLFWHSVFLSGAMEGYYYYYLFIFLVK